MAGFDDIVVDLGREVIYAIRHSLWCRTAILHIVFDAKVCLGTTGVVAGCEQDTTSGLAKTNHM